MTQGPIAHVCGFLCVAALLLAGFPGVVWGQCAPEELAKLLASDAAASDVFGHSVAVSGDTAVVGAWRDDHVGATDAGSAYVFVRTGGVWIQQAKLTASDAAANDEFGHSVAVSGETAVIGARGNDHSGKADAGSAYVFVRTGGVWTQQAKLTALGAAAGDLFGDSVAVSGETAVIGADYDNHAGGSDAGSAYVFVRSGGVWTQQARLAASDAAASDHFGVSVAIAGETAVIGAYYDDDGGSSAGSAYVFVRSGGVWTQQAKLTASDAAASDYFGRSVAVSGDTAVIGAYGDDDGGSSAGSAYVFVRSGGVWTQQAKLTASDAAASDQFGYSVAVSGGTAVVGTYGDDYAGNTDAGSAYVFVSSGGVWTQQAQLTASDAATDDHFGYSVAVSGDTAVSGACYDHHAGGVDAGSAYVFDLGCDPDNDDDGIADDVDNCPWDYNPLQENSDNDGFGDVCDVCPADPTNDADLDGICGDVDNCPSDYNPLQEDADSDGRGNVCDNCPSNSNPLQEDADSDGLGDACDVCPADPANDVDLDGICGGVDNCPLSYNPLQEDTDSDGLGDVCDACPADPANDADLDGICANVDNCPSDYNPLQEDPDTDGLGNVCDNCLWDYNPLQEDADSDGAGDACDYCVGTEEWAKLLVSGTGEFGSSVAVSGDTAVIAAYKDDLPGKTDAGSAYVFVRTGGVWTQQARLIASDAAEYDYFGRSVAISGDTAVIGASGAENSGAYNSGSAYVFVRTGGVWIQQAKLRTFDAVEGDELGNSVAVSGDTAVIGVALGDLPGETDAGSAYVFVRAGGVWNPQAKLTASDSGAGANFGGSVAVSGDTAVIGASTAGFAYVFVRTGGVWTQQTQLTASDAAAYDRFGVSVAVSGDTTVIGANGDDDGGSSAGSAYVFVRSGGVWNQHAKLTASDAAASDLFGFSVAVSGDTAVIGAYGDDDGGSSAGSTYVFVRSGGVWNQQAKLTASDAAASDLFGFSVAVSGDTAVIGAYGDDDGGSNAGSAYVFELGCIPDGDNDGVLDDVDNCPWDTNPLQEDADTDGVGDVCDNCPWDTNPSQDNSDQDGLGDACDACPDDPANDADLDGICADVDNCPSSYNPLQEDADTDGLGDVCDNCPLNYNPLQEDSDNDGLADACDACPKDPTNDVDLDGICGGVDNCPWNYNPLQEDADTDSAGDACDYCVGTEELAKLLASDAAAGHQLGRAVAVSGGTAVIGASFDDHVGGTDAGSVYVFVPFGGVWTQQAKLTASDAAEGDYFGDSVAVSGDTAVIGAAGNDGVGGDYAGSAYIFVRAGGVWTEQAKLAASDTVTYDYFGYSVAVSGDTAVIGAVGDEDGGTSAGSAYVFVRSGGVWSQQAKLLASDTAANDEFGDSVAVSGDTVVIGASRHHAGTTGAGSAYVFVRSDGVWTQQAKLTASDAAAGDYFGRSVAVSGDTAVIGAVGDDDGGSSAGSAYVFVRSGEVWAEQAKLIASDAATDDYFGRSVAVSGGMAVIGTIWGDSAYLFVRSDGSWTQQVKLTPSDTTAGNHFGESVALSGNTAVIGAFGDDDGGSSAGSAYVFELGCDPDDDGDGVPDASDNCPSTANPAQADCDSNGIGDACEPGATDCNTNGTPDECEVLLKGDMNYDGAATPADWPAFSVCYTGPCDVSAGPCAPALYAAPCCRSADYDDDGDVDLVDFAVFQR
jgi:hypothetical protein